MFIHIKNHPELTKEEIDKTRDLYKKIRSIEKVSKLLSHSPVTISKYCSDLIAEDRRSRYHNNKVLQFYPKTGELLVTYNNLTVASEVTKISKSNICKALKGHTKTAGGYIWRYLDELEQNPVEKIEKYFVSESKRIDRILFL